MKNYIIPLFIPHFGCPHTCVFCNQRKITGMDTNVTAAEVQRIIGWHLAQIDRPYFVEAAFYGGSFTALSEARQRELLAPAAAYFAAGRLQGIRLSTRPDCIHEDNLSFLWDMGVRTIELGAQSFDDGVLCRAERGHCALDICQAADRIRQKGFRLGIQLMPGLPGDTEATMRHSLAETLRLQPDMVRIYPTVVLRDTPLATAYRAGKYQPLSMAGAVRIAAIMKLALEQRGIEVIRTGLQSGEELDAPGTVLAGPYHPAFGEMVESWLFNVLVERQLERWQPVGEVVLHHADRDTSQLRGLKNTNQKHWQQQYPRARFQLCPDGTQRNRLQIEYDGHSCVLDKNALEGL